MKWTSALALSLVLLAGCSNQVPDSTTETPVSAQAERGQAAADFFAAVRHRLGDGCRSWKSLSDFLANTTVEVLDVSGSPIPNPGVMEGHLLVRATAVSFRSSERAKVEFTLRVNEVLAGPSPGGDSVDVAMNLDGTVEEIGAGLLDVGDSLWVLYKSPLFAHDPSLWAVSAEGKLIATIADDGRLAMPGLSREIEAEMLRRTPTIDDLRAEAAGPGRTIAAPMAAGCLHQNAQTPLSD
jgi:hypothetical protein